MKKLMNLLAIFLVVFGMTMLLILELNLIILLLIFPEILGLAFAFIIIIMEFILRLFGKSFDDK